MKFLHSYLLLSFCLAIGCTSHPVQFDKSLTIVLDVTDPSPVPNASDIVNQLHLSENLWQGVTIKVTSISDRDVSDSKNIILKPEDKWTNNTTIRQSEISSFKKALTGALVESSYNKSLSHSIIYRKILNECTALSTASSKERYLAIYSDLMEHSDVDFYNSKTFTLLTKNAIQVQHQLEHSGQLPNLSGIKVWLIYNPSTYEANNTYMAIARFYKLLLEAHGATVHIEHSFTTAP